MDKGIEHGIRPREWGSINHVVRLPRFTNDTRPDSESVGALILNTDDESVEVYNRKGEWTTLLQMDGLVDIIETMKNKEDNG